MVCKADVYGGCLADEGGVKQKKRGWWWGILCHWRLRELALPIRGGKWIRYNYGSAKLDHKPLEKRQKNENPTFFDSTASFDPLRLVRI